MSDTPTKPNVEPKARGASFPVLSLPEAVKIVAEAGSHSKQHSMNAMAGYAGHSTVNSGGFRAKMAALRDWGFVAGSGDTVILTETAMAIAHPTSDEAMKKALGQAFQGCPVFMRIYDGLAKGKEFDRSNIGNLAVNNHSVAVASKEKFVASFIDSAESVGRIEKTGGTRFRVLALATPDDAVDSGHPVHPGDTASLPSDNALGRKTPPGATAPVIRQAWPIAGGEIVLEVRSTGPLAAGVFAKLGLVVGQLEELAVQLNPAVRDAPDDPE